jgi:predicted nuclease of restriction endonuclease-like RecB superfamily
VGFWTPEYLDAKLMKIQEADLDHLLIAVSERLECSADDFEGASERLLWFKSGIHVYDMVELAEAHALKGGASKQNH